jgi:5-methylthioadenosine/S-adenosylhomocysteine deaminase
MKFCDQLIHAKWMITCEDDQPLLENHSLVIQQGKILAILPSDQANQQYKAEQTVDYHSHVVMPGFINAHTHIAMNWFRGLADDLALMDWLNNHIWPAERHWVNYDFVKDASLFAMGEMIRSGTLCFNDMYFFPDATAEATLTAGIRGHIGITIINFPTAWAKDTEEYFTKGFAFYERYKHHENISTTLTPHALYTVDEKTLLRVHRLAEDHQLKIMMHIQETADEVNQSIAQSGLRPLQRLQNIGFISPRLIAVHMTQINEEDLEILQIEKPHIVHCPESNMKLASGICPVEKLQSFGLNVALGTDGAASNNDLNMIGEMHSATLLAKLASANPEALSAYDTIKLATLNGAKALGIDHLTGSLKAGKSADFIAINLDEIETLPLYHPTSQVVYAASRNQITDAWLAGRQLLKNRELMTLDEEELKHKAKRWSIKIAKDA